MGTMHGRSTLDMRAASSQRLGPHWQGSSDAPLWPKPCAVWVRASRAAWQHFLRQRNHSLGRAERPREVQDDAPDVLAAGEVEARLVQRSWERPRLHTACSP